MSLRPCPFCGFLHAAPKIVRLAGLEEADDIIRPVPRWAVVCGGCSARGGEGKDEETAVAMWTDPIVRDDPAEVLPSD